MPSREIFPFLGTHAAGHCMSICKAANCFSSHAPPRRHVCPEIKDDWAWWTNASPPPPQPPPLPPLLCLPAPCAQLQDAQAREAQLQGELAQAAENLVSVQTAMKELLKTNDDLSRRMEGLESVMRTQASRAREGGGVGGGEGRGKGGMAQDGRACARTCGRGEERRWGALVVPEGRAGSGQGLTCPPLRPHPPQERSKVQAETKAADTEAQMASVAGEIMRLRNEMSFKEQVNVVLEEGQGW